MRISKSVHSTAYHEAGHAVAAWDQELRFRHVTIKPSGDSLGHILHHKHKMRNIDSDVSERNRMLTERYVLVSLAGYCAERKFNPHGIRSYSWKSDRDNAVDLLDYFADSEDELRLYLRLMLCRASNMMEKPFHWRALECLADALVERQTLRGTEATEVIFASQNVT